jgi:2-polyprenyl-3-methyl-5-hydroxy-6-metoxy-1,4-benzoquinol methylase
MGYARDKYTKTYFLRRDEQGQPTAFGVMGLEEFEKGGIRAQDQAILAALQFGGKTVLEFGFGRGEAIKYALEHGARRVVGVDFSEDAAQIARQFLQQHGLTAEIVCADALEFVMRPNSGPPYDLVLMLDVIEHIPRSELATLLRALHRVLNPQAVLAINTPVFGVDNDVLTEGLKFRARDESDDFPETAGMHCNRYTKASLRRFMRTCGYGAIAGHFFVNNLSASLLAVETGRAWRNAHARGYPAVGPAKPEEHFDIAYSSRQQDRLRRLPSNPTLNALGRRLLSLLWRLGVKP